MMRAKKKRINQGRWAARVGSDGDGAGGEEEDVDGMSKRDVGVHPPWGTLLSPPGHRGQGSRPHPCGHQEVCPSSSSARPARLAVTVLVCNPTLPSRAFQSGAVCLPHGISSHACFAT